MLLQMGLLLRIKLISKIQVVKMDNPVRRQKQREGACQERHTRDVSNYKWEELVKNCKLASLTVA